MKRSTIFKISQLYRKMFSKSDNRVLIGRGTYGISSQSIFLFKKTDSVTIGNYCSFAPEVAVIASGEHNFNAVSTYPLGGNLCNRSSEIDTLSKGPITIGNDVWVSFRSTILSGVTIGDGVVIGAHSLVTKDLPPYCIAGGVPAKIIQYRFSPDIINKLLKIAWWNWEEVDIINRIDDFYGDINMFVEKYY